jgi:hypothetical protein
MSSHRVIRITLHGCTSIQGLCIATCRFRRFEEDVHRKLFDHLKTRLKNSEKTASYVRELVSQPGENRSGAEGEDSYVEVETEFVGRCICDAAKNGVAMHLSEDPDYADTQEDKQESETPVDELMGLKGIRVPCNDGEHEGRAGEEHKVANIYEHRPD